MQKVEIFTERKYFIRCQNCTFPERHYVDHLMSEATEEAPRSFGPWVCRGCNFMLNGRVAVVGDDVIVEAESVPNTRSTRHATGLVLLRSDHSASQEPIYLVVKDRYVEVDVPMEEAAEHRRYWYNEHTCLTNWTDKIIAVIMGGDDDPHGAFQYVSHVMAADVLPAFREYDSTWETKAQLGKLQIRDIFPQPFEKPDEKPQQDEDPAGA